MENHIAIQIAERLAGHLPQPMANELKLLIAQNREAQSDPTTKIIGVLSQNENSLLWFLEQMELLSGGRDGTRGFSPLPGDSSAPISNQWVCPEDASETLPVIQEGEPAPRCNKHDVKMVRAGG